MGMLILVKMVLGNQITWDSYSSHMKLSLHKMMMTEQFTDVTLVTADQTKIKAHKNILASCSKAFGNIFQDQDDHSNAIIYLKGIKEQVLRSILEYIYSGEAKVNLDCLNDFLSTAKELEICELYENTGLSEVSKEVEADASTTRFIDTETFVKKEAQISSSYGEHKKLEKRRRFPCLLCREKGKNKSYKTKLYLNDHIHRQHREKNIFCDQCDFKCSRKNLLNVHVKNVHEEKQQLKCDECDFTTLLRQSLKHHVDAEHKGIRYPCDFCDHQAKDKKNLEKHKQNRHFEEIDIP